MNKRNQKIKADANKEMISLVPTDVIKAIARVREFGVAKYKSRDSWKTVERDRYIDALGRHYLAYIDDIDGNDEESGLPHIWHIACNAAFLCWHYNQTKKKVK